MSRDKQISEMAKDLCECYVDYDSGTIDIKSTSERLFAKNYRKQSDVAREIFEEIEKTAMSKIDTDLSIAVLNDTYYIEAIDELKKKYTESEKDNG